MQTFTRNNARGFSLIELLLVLGVLAILLVAAFVVYPQVRDRNQANAEVSNLTTIKANINNLYASKGGNYTGLTNTVALNARAYPQNMVIAAGADPVANPAAAAAAWGGAVTTVVNAGSARLFDITYAAVPDGVCLGLVSGAAGNFENITVDGTTVFTAGAFDPALAAGECNGAAAGGATIVFSSN